MPIAVERALRKEAKKKKLRGKRKEAYIWGGLRRTGWTPSTQKKNKSAPSL